MNEAITFVTRVRVEDTITLMLHGEFDVSTAEVLTDSLGAVGDRIRHVIVDLRDASFFGLAALDLVVDAHRRLADLGGILEVISVSESVALMMRALGDDHLLPTARILLPDVADTDSAASRDRPAARTGRRVITTLSVQSNIRVATR